MAQYRQKLQIVEAVQFDPTIEPWPEGVAFLSSATPKHEYLGEKGEYFLHYCHGLKPLDPGDWIFTDSLGHRNSMKPEQFAASYEAVI